jgi:hypothetical protein
MLDINWSQHYFDIREMSDQKDKEKPKKFLLPSSLKNMQQHYRNESIDFAT